MNRVALNAIIVYESKDELLEVEEDQETSRKRIKKQISRPYRKGFLDLWIGDLIVKIRGNQILLPIDGVNVLSWN